jgi:hypothetical protein
MGDGWVHDPNLECAQGDDCQARGLMAGVVRALWDDGGVPERVGEPTGLIGRARPNAMPSNARTSFSYSCRALVKLGMTPGASGFSANRLVSPTITLNTRYVFSDQARRLSIWSGVSD